MQEEYYISIPARNVNAPKTTLYVKIVAKCKASLQTKPYVFLLPGGPGFNHSNYQKYICLQDMANIVFHDPRGCGLSAIGDAATYTMDNYIDDVNEIRKYLQLDKVIIIGKSYGAMCALGFTIRYPNHVKQLVLAAGSPSYKLLETAKANFLKRNPSAEQKRVCEQLWNGTFKNDEELTYYVEVMTPFYSYRVRQGESISKFKSESESESESESKTINPYSHEPLNQGFKNLFGRFDYQPQLKNIECETLILVGEEDWITDKKYSEQMAKQIPNSKLIVFSKSDHAMELDVPKQYFNGIRSFIAHKSEKKFSSDFFQKQKNVIDTLHEDQMNNFECH